MNSFARSRMTHRALVQRDTGTAVNRYNQRQPDAWTTHLEALPCFFYTSPITPPEGEDVQVERTAVVERLRLLVPRDADVTERDRIATVTDRIGNAVYDSPLNIRSVLPRRRTHKELVLESVQ